MRPSRTLCPIILQNDAVIQPIIFIEEATCKYIYATTVRGALFKYSSVLKYRNLIA